jgi:hypothetical protein
MVKILLCVVGVLVAAGGVVAVWHGFDRYQESERLGQDIYVEQSQMAYGKKSQARQEQGEKKIADWEQEIKAKQTESYIWIGVGPVAVIVGATLALVPFLGKPKRRVTAPEPAQSADVAGDGGGQ